MGEMVKSLQKPDLETELWESQNLSGCDEKFDSVLEGFRKNSFG